MIKQVIVLRREYPDGRGGTFRPRIGKLISSACHASLKVILDRMQVEKVSITTHRTGEPRFREYSMIIPQRSALHKWLSGSFTKIVVYVNSEEELMDLYVKVQLGNLPHALICDMGKTEFHGQETYTCLAIGPSESNEIDLLTGNLKLL